MSRLKELLEDLKEAVNEDGFEIKEVQLDDGEVRIISQSKNQTKSNQASVSMSTEDRDDGVAFEARGTEQNVLDLLANGFAYFLVQEVSLSKEDKIDALLYYTSKAFERLMDLEDDNKKEGVKH